MADAMKLVPVEPTEAMIEAMDQAVFTHGNVIDAYRAMLAASPPAREEAPAEGAGEMHVVPRKPSDREIGEILYNINRKRNHSELTEYDVREVMDNYFYNVGQPGPAALRNRTSEPEAGAIGQVNALYASGFGRMRCIEWAAGDMPEVGTKLYAHPAPATADKLRVAKEALEKARGHRQLTHVYAGIDAALAALNGQSQ